MRILFIPPQKGSPSSRYRLTQFAPALAARGHTVEEYYIRPSRHWQSSQSNSLIRNLHNRFATILRLISVVRLWAIAPRYDVIMMNRDLVPETRIRFLEPILARRNPHLIFDIDDAIYLGKRKQKLQQILPHFAWIIAGNETIEKVLQPISHNISVWPSVVNTELYKPAIQRHPGVVRIGWTGSAGPRRDHLPQLRPIMCRLAQIEQFEFIVISDQDPQLAWPGVTTRFFPWTEETEVSTLQWLDIGVMPLFNREFDRAKCGMKAVQYMGIGIPAVVSPIGTNTSIVLDGQTGFHAHTDDEWVEKLLLLIRKPALREQMGRAAYTRVEQHYSINSLLPKMLDIFQQVSGNSK